MHQLIREIEQRYMPQDIPDFRPGDTLKLHLRVKEGEKERTQIFEGLVIRVRGSGLGKTFTVRKVSYGVGMERTFPIACPSIQKIEVVKRGVVRRAKLYYIRNLKGKSAKIRELKEWEIKKRTAESKAATENKDNGQS